MGEKLSIAVIGLGLMGGSLLKALKPYNYNLIAVSRSEETLLKAKQLNLANEYHIDISAVSSADIVFVCTPINKTIETIDKLTSIVSEKAIVTDIASVKNEILDFVNNLPKPLRFIGGHPMAGTEHKGIDNSFKELYEAAKWVLVSSKFVSDTEIKILTEVIEKIGANVILADAQEHDNAVAMISHAPLLLSQALFDYVSTFSESKKLALALASSGFRDTTRLAATNPELAQDMLFSNKKNVQNVIKEFIKNLENLNELLETDEKSFVEFIEKTAENRSKMYSKDGKNIYK